MDSPDKNEYILCVTNNNGTWATNNTGLFALTKQKPASVQPWFYQFSKVKAQMGAPLVYYVENGSKVELAGKENWGFTSVYKLKLTDKTNVETLYYIDVNSYYLIKIAKNNINFVPIIKKKNIVGYKLGSVTVTFSNYQKTDFGYVMPFTISVATQVWDKNGKTDEINAVSTVKKVLINQDVDPKIFDKPQ